MSNFVKHIQLILNIVTFLSILSSFYMEHLYKWKVLDMLQTRMM